MQRLVGHQRKPMGNVGGSCAAVLETVDSAPTRRALARLNLSLAALSSGHDPAASLRLHRTVAKAQSALLVRGWDRAPQPHAGEDGKDIRITIRRPGLTSICHSTAGPRPHPASPVAASRAPRPARAWTAGSEVRATIAIVLMPQRPSRAAQKRKIQSDHRQSLQRAATAYVFDSLGDLNFMEEPLMVVWTIRWISRWIIGG